MCHQASPSATRPPAKPVASMRNLLVTAATPLHWESELASLLNRLSSAQRELLSLLSTKRELIVRRDHEGLTNLVAREGELAAELQACQQRRQELLRQADAEGLPSRSIEEL